MTSGLGSCCYRLALQAASRRDISAAALYARYACILDAEHSGAARLLGLCLRELGDPEAAQYLPEGSPMPAAAEDTLEKIRLLGGRKKWRAAARAARSLPGESPRFLNIRGCLCALAGRYSEAADFFARALAKDRGNSLAQAGLGACCTCRFLWPFSLKNAIKTTINGLLRRQPEGVKGFGG
jgi:tetratricopeptide (TPR) repeat protein